jgi:hypothetical protein
VLLFLHPGAKGEDELDAALYWCHPGTRGKLISGTFSGVFHFKAVYIGDSALGTQPDARSVFPVLMTLSLNRPIRHSSVSCPLS